MLSKLLKQGLQLFVFLIIGLSISLIVYNDSISRVYATITPQHQVVNTQTATKLEKDGNYYYQLQQFETAISLWQQAIRIYEQELNHLSHARVLSKLALAYSQLNQQQQATATITKSWKILTESQYPTAELSPVLAQVLNNQGIIELSQGARENAIATWDRAKVYYQQAADELGLVKIAVNQASAFKQAGLYHQALKSLTALNDSLEQQPDSVVKVTALRSYGDILRLVGQKKRSQAILQASLAVANRLNAHTQQVKTLLLLGKSYRGESDQQAAQYKQALTICQQHPECLNSDLVLQLYLAQLHLYLNSANWQNIDPLIPLIKNQFQNLPDNRTLIDLKVNFAHNLVKLNSDKKKQLKNLPHNREIEEFIDNTIKQAQDLDYQQAQSYGYGIWGKIKEQEQDWKNAQIYTQKALILAQNLNSPEITYLWQWQLGRIHQGLQLRPQAIAYYLQAVELLKSLSLDLVAIDPDVQYSFRDSVEPVYRELVSLLLTTEKGQTVTQTNLKTGQEIIESLQLAELTDFFREACLTQSTEINTIDPQAAIIYPIILKDRLEVILSLPNQPLQHYQIFISAIKLEEMIEEFRQSIVIRSRRNFYRPAQQLYNILVRPALEDLIAQHIKTLVFVPDGALRNLAWGALHDGREYLIENYSVAITPGLKLLTPRPLQQLELKTIAAGLTKPRQGFSALEYVGAELKQINKAVETKILLNQDFTAKALEEQIQYWDHPIVHIATHGQFSSSIEDTFILSWDKPINIQQLESILKTRNNDQKQAIELLILSACETAVGDKRAALGLAGMAVRTGARSTLATLWSVNDDSAAKLMGNFYQQLANQQITKAEAVRQAQLSLLDNPSYKHPFYWAAYILLGNWL
ncbi:hypothetical protein NIES4102_38880 [Chondrocystis sp. NIES-4102]|nr:hypothetical protein NIES4102_38880 [Chondrocystis sp. NIES-4102]